MLATIEAAGKPGGDGVGNGIASALSRNLHWAGSAGMRLLALSEKNLCAPVECPGSAFLADPPCIRLALGSRHYVAAQ